MSRNVNTQVPKARQLVEKPTKALRWVTEFSKLKPINRENNYCQNKLSRLTEITISPGNGQLHPNVDVHMSQRERKYQLEWF